MMRIYSIRPSFYKTVQVFPHVLEALTEKQIQDIVENVDICELKESAESFFQAQICLEMQEISMRHSVTGKVFRMQCKQQYVEIDDERNPFYIFLKRKFRYIFTCASDFM